MFYYGNRENEKFGPFENSEFNNLVIEGSIVKTSKIYSGDKVIIAGDMKNVEWPEAVDLTGSEMIKVVSIFIGLILFLAVAVLSFTSIGNLPKEFQNFAIIALISSIVSIAVTIFLFKILLDIRKTLKDIHDAISKR